MSYEKSTPTTLATPTDEIDLFELIEELWQEKLIVIALTAIFTLAAIAYALLATPVYQAQTFFYQPAASVIQPYNVLSNAFRNAEYEVGQREVERYSVKSVYDVFVKNLTSRQLRNVFFEEVYLPSLEADERETPRIELLSRLDSVLKVKKSNSATNNFLYEVAVDSPDAGQAAEWANRYVQQAVLLTKKELKQDVLAEINYHKASLQLQIKNLQAQAEAERLDEIVRLQEALSIAEAIGLENPSMPDGKSTEEGANYVDRNLTYMRGAKALRSQIALLKKRENNEAFIPGLRAHMATLDLLEELTLDDARAEVVEIDQIAEVPTKPIKPNKRLIAAIGVVFGGMLGVFVALVRIAVRQRKAAKA